MGGLSWGSCLLCELSYEASQEATWNFRGPGSVPEWEGKVWVLSGMRGRQFDEKIQNKGLARKPSDLALV